MKPEEQKLWDDYWADRSESNRNKITVYYYSDIKRLCRWYCGKCYSLNVDDLISDSVAHVMTHTIPAYHGKSSFSGFLFKAVQAMMTLQMDRATAKKRQGTTTSESQEGGTLFDFVAHGPSVADAAATRETVALVRLAISTLNSSDAEFLTTYVDYIGGSKMQTLGEQFEMDAKQIDNTLCRLKVLIRRRYKILENTPDNKKELVLAAMKRRSDGMTPRRAKKTWKPKKRYETKG